MKFTVRRSHYTRHGFEHILKVVEIEDHIWKIMVDWAIAVQPDLIAAQTEDIPRQELCDSFNAMTRTLPREYRLNNDKGLAVSHFFTLISDNPTMLPAEVPAVAREAIAA